MPTDFRKLHAKTSFVFGDENLPWLLDKILQYFISAMLTFLVQFNLKRLKCLREGLLHRNCKINLITYHVRQHEGRGGGHWCPSILFTKRGRVGWVYPVHVLFRVLLAPVLSREGVRYILPRQILVLFGKGARYVLSRHCLGRSCLSPGYPK